jgi:hypothetical protein
MPRNSHLLTNNPDRFTPRDIKQPRVFSSNRRPYSEYRQRTDYLDYKTFHVHKMEEDTYVHPGNLFLPSLSFVILRCNPGRELEGDGLQGKIIDPFS